MTSSLNLLNREPQPDSGDLRDSQVQKLEATMRTKRSRAGWGAAPEEDSNLIRLGTSFASKSVMSNEDDLLTESRDPTLISPDESIRSNSAYVNDTDIMSNSDDNDESHDLVGPLGNSVRSTIFDQNLPDRNSKVDRTSRKTNGLITEEERKSEIRTSKINEVVTRASNVFAFR